jgi:hypothetical protein
MGLTLLKALKNLIKMMAHSRPSSNLNITKIMRRLQVFRKGNKEKTEIKSRMRSIRALSRRFLGCSETKKNILKINEDFALHGF